MRRRATRIAERFIGIAPSLEIECDDLARRREKGNKAIIEVKVVWEAVHQNDGWHLAQVFSGVNLVSVPAYKRSCEIHRRSGYMAYLWS
jgi:hypothetical protein